jgi:hypothetical protein
MEKLLPDALPATQVQCLRYFMIMQASLAAQEVHSISLTVQMVKQVVSMNLSFVLPLDSTESLESWMCTILLVSIWTIRS